MMKVVGLMILVVTMTGCSIYPQQFACRAGKGLPCQSVSTINAKVDSGSIETPVNKVHLTRHYGHPLPTFNEKPTTKLHKVVRSPERTLRIWIASFTDKQDSFLEEQYVYKVITPSRWQEQVDDK